MKYLLAIALLFTTAAQAKDFPIFDGRSYNGLFYPRVDLIEWADNKGEPTHLEFHFYAKDKPMDLALQVGEKGGRPVVWVNYDLKFRGERVCRHAPAPAHFSASTKIYAYRDNSAKDYDNLYITSTPMMTSKTLTAVELQPYYICAGDEMASNMPNGPLPPGAQPTREVASSAAPVAADVELYRPSGQNPADKGVHVDYENSSLPFSF